MKPCPSFEGYSASEDGRVFSHRRRGVRVAGHGGTQSLIDLNHCFELAQHARSKGYRTVSISFGGGKTRPVGVHQLVADAFIGPAPEGLEVRHRNGIASDNRAENLLYGTSQDNANDRAAHGTYLSGGAHRGAKLTDAQAATIRDLRGGGSKVKALAAQFGISVSTVESIIYGKSYKQVSQ